MKKFVRKAAKTGFYLYQSVRFGIMKMLFRPDRNLVVFESYQGRSCACSPKALYTHLLGSPTYAEMRFIWVLRNPEDPQYTFLKNKRTRLVQFDSFAALKAYARAGWWVTNSRLREYLTPGTRRVYLQCWHGVPFKKIGCDITVGGNAISTVKKIHKEYRQEGKRFRWLVSPSAFCSEIFTSAFALNQRNGHSRLLELGYPRNDDLFFFQGNRGGQNRVCSAWIRRVREDLGIPEQKRVILYAPTFRDNQFQTGKGYTFTPALDFAALQKVLPEDCVVLFRAHYLVAQAMELAQYVGFVYNVSDYGDINDLYLISDVLVTDYSSVFFDYAILNRPMLFYLYDYAEYRDKMRDFYFGTDVLPGRIVSTQPELAGALCNILDGADDFRAKRAEFNRIHNSLNGGCAAQKVAEAVFGKSSEK